MNIPGFNRHRSWSELASGFADGSLDPGEADRFAAHISGCARCQAEVSDYRAIRAAAQSLPDLAAPRSFRLTPAMLLDPPRDEPLALPAPSRASRAVQVGARITAGVAAAALAAIVVIDLRGVTSSDTETASTDLASEAAPASAPVTDTAATAAGESLASATSAAETPPTPEATAPTDGTPEVSGAGAGHDDGPDEGEDGGGEGGSAAPQSTPTASPPEPYVEDSDAERSSETQSAYAETTAQNQAVDDGSGDDSEALLRAAEIALGVLLVAALGVIVFVPVRRRSRQ